MFYLYLPLRLLKAVTLCMTLLLVSVNLSAVENVTEAENSYKLGAGDMISVTVYGESDLSMDVLISNSGRIDYPYLGRITVKNRTAAELKQQITEGLRGDYLINPKVAVNIIQYRQIYVNGEVERPGGYAYQPGLTIEKAIALAGGFTERAAKSSITITPGDGSADKVSVPLKRKIAPGDIIIVKASFF